MNIPSSLLTAVSQTYQNHEGALVFSGVSIDSRVYKEGHLFVPIVGERFDGHDFLRDAIENGAKGALWDRTRSLPSDLAANFPIYFVDDTLEALQGLAKKYLQAVAPIVVGITGSNGKTTTKDLLDSVLSQQFNTHKTQGNFNNHIGLPLTILAMPEETEVVILEMGMNHFGEISFLSQLAEPDYAIVTNIGESHIENLGSREGIARAKMEIIDGLKETGAVFIDGDEPLLASFTGERQIRSGFSETNDVVIASLNGSEVGFSFTIEKQGVKNEYFLPLLGQHNVKNASYVVALAYQLKLGTEKIRRGFETLTATGMRLERQPGKNNSLLINDSYNASPTSMVAAVETIKAFDNYDKKVLVLGDMYELGMNEEQLHRSVAAHIQAPITHLITVGQKGVWIADECRRKSNSTIEIYSFLTKEEASPKLEKLLTDQTVVLFKASRGMKVETMIEPLTN